MNYFQAYLPSLDETIVAAWDSQMTDAAETSWLARELDAKHIDLFPRFASCYAELRALPRGARRALQRRLARPCELSIPAEWRRKLARSLAGAALLLALAQGAAQAATITVNTTNPAINTGDNRCSLIEAIQNANDTGTGQPNIDCTAGDPLGADTIFLPANKKITLTISHGFYYGSNTGLPLITSPITIEGMRSKIVRKPNSPDLFRILSVSTTGHLTLRNVTLGGGRSSTDGGAIFTGGVLVIENSTISANSANNDGGGVFNSVNGTTTISNSKILRNAGYGGGGIFNNGTITIEDSTIWGNTADGLSVGGAILNNYGTITIDNSTISRNRAYAYGAGGIFSAAGTITIANSTISRNTAPGICNCGEGGITSIANSTISGNTAQSGYGGGVFNGLSGTVTIENSTISNNTVNSGGGIYNYSNGTTIIRNSTISSNRVSNLGGAIRNHYGTITIDNSTVSSNTSDNLGGGIFSCCVYYGVVTLSNSTVTGNKADAGGGMYNKGSLDLDRSLISGNKALTGREVYNDSTGTITAANFNIFGVSSNAGLFGFSEGATDLVPTVPLDKIIRSLLKTNGNPSKTKSHALPNNSPAIDAVPLADPACTGTDQRGVSRPQGGGCDIGAFELE